MNPSWETRARAACTGSAAAPGCREAGRGGLQGPLDRTRPSRPVCGFSLVHVPTERPPQGPQAWLLPGEGWGPELHVGCAEGRLEGPQAAPPGSCLQRLQAAGLTGNQRWPCVSGTTVVRLRGWELGSSLQKP